MRVAVTGATGYLGSAVCRALSRRGAYVAGLTRGEGGVPTVDRWVPGDLGDERSLSRLLEGADVVVHAAGLVRSSDVAALTRTNVKGTEAIVRAAAAVRVPRVVHLSTAGVHGRPGVAVDETAPLRPANAYERSKALAERIVTALPGGTWAIVRPTDVIGVGHPLNPLVRFLRSVERSRLWASARAWTNYVAVDDVAALVAEVALVDGAPAVIFANDPLPLPELVRAAGTVLGADIAWHELPRPLTAALGPRAGGLAVRSPRVGRLAALFDETRFVTRHDSWLIDHDLAPSVVSTLSAMVEDYRQRDLL